MKPFLEEICTTYVKCLCLNFHNLTESSTSVLQKYPFSQFWRPNGRAVGDFLQVKFGLKVVLRACKRIDILQLLGIFVHQKILANKIKEIAFPIILLMTSFQMGF